MKSQAVSPDFFGKLTRYFWWGFLTLTSLAVFVPLKPAYPNVGLDQSWMFGLNQAVAQKLVFGRDVTFTFGPYASIYTMEYHPGTDALMVWGSLFLGVCYAGLLILLSRRMRSYWLFAYAVFLVVGVTGPGSSPSYTRFIFGRDALLFSYPLLLAFVVLVQAMPDSEGQVFQSVSAQSIALSILAIPLGLLPLIKGSFLFVAAAIAFLCFALFWQQGKKVLGANFLLLPMVALLLFWSVAGQRVSALPLFLIRTGRIISGYTEAMALPGRPLEVVFYLCVAGLILYAIAMNGTWPVRVRLFLSSAYAVFLFSAFKAGFVRHDFHAMAAGTCVFIAALFLAGISTTHLTIVSLLAAFLVWAYIDNHYVSISPESLSQNLRDTYASAWEGLGGRISGNTMRSDFDQTLRVMQKNSAIPELQGTTDIYSFHQSELLASRNEWLPRPIMQSYSAYGELAGVNEARLQNENGPDNVIFRVEPIDGRFPALEDGLSWPELINNYSVVNRDDSFVYLRRRETRHIKVERSEISAATHKFGEAVPVPASQAPLFVNVDISPTVAGRILAELFKPPQLSISVELSDGTTRTYRLIANMAKPGFLLSPLVENTTDFIFLTGSGNNWLADKTVRTLTVDSPGDKAIFWHSEYRVKFSTVELSHDTNLAKLEMFDPLTSQAPKAIPKQETECEGTIEQVNERLPLSVAQVSNRLSVEGWTAMSTSQGVLPDSVFVTLSDAQERLFVRARPRATPELGERFRHVSMLNAGFTAEIDISKMSGRYVLGVSRVYRGQVDRCSQLELPLQVMPSSSAMEAAPGRHAEGGS